jgi:hypothetical protein
MRFHLSLLSSILTMSLFSQRDPQWLMPLYFQDANGDMDTVYFGYDQEASTFDDADSILGERWIIIDSARFNIFLFQYPYGQGGYLYTDTVKKVDIRRSFIGTTLGFCKGKLPITMKWVDSLLYAPSCPFPDLSPRPRARIDLVCDDLEGPYNSCQEFDGPPLSLTDYPAPEIPYPVLDSMVFDGSGLYAPSQVFRYVNLSLVPHNYTYAGIKYESQNKLKIFPNPFSDNLTIETTNFKYSFIKIYNTIGLLVFKQSTYKDTLSISLGQLPRGVYLISVSSDNDYFIQKLIKSK